MSESPLRLFNYFRSSASYRVRVTLNLKGLTYDYLPVHLVKNEQLAESFVALNPEGLVPVLDVGGQHLTQSIAICEYLDEVYPEPPILPREALARARVRSLALLVACDIHPLNNLRVLRYLTGECAVDEDMKNTWYRHWVEEGLGALERQLATSASTGSFCHGEAPTLADICLVPQVFNGLRFKVDFSATPNIMRIYENCLLLPAFAAAAPDQQPDAQ